MSERPTALLESSHELHSSELERELVQRLAGERGSPPVLPEVAQAAMRLANDPAARINELASLVDADPPIAARFMAIANSVISLRGWITSSTQSAIVRLGLAGTRDLLFQVVCASSSERLVRYRSAVQASFRRSVIAAHAARVVSRELSIGTEYDYLSGLLHDVGESRILCLLDDLELPTTDEQVSVLVAKYHERAGAELATAWTLPSAIVDACAAHHDPAAAADPNVRLVMIADCVVAALAAEPGPRKRELDLEPFDKLLIDAGIARRLIEKTRSLLAD